jgi:hypothetical protein
MKNLLDALQKSAKSQQKGDLLELVLVDILKDLGFQQVTKQQSGTQFGFDVIAYRTSPIDGLREVWKFECKNLAGRVTTNDIAPKLIWHIGQSTFDHFVIVSPSPISNELTFLLEGHSLPMPISLWSGEVLERLIKISPNAMQRLGFSFDPSSEDPNKVFSELPSFAPSFFTLDVVHDLNPPYSFDYIKSGVEVVKAYTEHEFRLVVSITNLTAKPITVKSLHVTTIQHEKVLDRVVRLHKAKGIYRPIQLQFTPHQNPGSKTDILGQDVWEIPAGHAEILYLVMPADVAPGLYQLVFSVDALVDGLQLTRISPQMMVHIPDKDTDQLLLMVNGRHYESPVSTVLNLDDRSWNKLKRQKKKQNTFTFLGPGLHEMMFGYKDPTWTIRSCDAQPQDDGVTSIIDPYKPSEIVMDLGLEINEELPCGPEAVFSELKKKPIDIIPEQLKRRAAFRSQE